MRNAKVGRRSHDLCGVLVGIGYDTAMQRCTRTLAEKRWLGCRSCSSAAGDASTIKKYRATRLHLNRSTFLSRHLQTTAPHCTMPTSALHPRSLRDQARCLHRGLQARPSRGAAAWPRQSGALRTSEHTCPSFAFPTTQALQQCSS